MSNRGRAKNPSVCIVVENLPVPLDRRVWREACALHAAGYEVTVICPRGKEQWKVAYEIIEGIEIYRHVAWEASGVVGYLLEYTLAFACEFLLTMRVFARKRFRILQACNPPDTIFLIALLLKPFGVRFIFDHHDLSPEMFEAKFGSRSRLLQSLTRLAEWCSFRTADICIATNESFKDVAITRGSKDPKDVFVVRNCPDLASFSGQVMPNPRKEARRLQVVYVGFMGKQDGLDLLLESIDYMVNVDNRQDTEFVLIGRGPVVPDLQKSIIAKRLQNYVTLTGQISHEDVVTHLRNADIGVAPDPKNPMNDKSTMIKIFEYMAASLPVVLFDLTEGRRIAGPAGLYAAPNDPIDLANQVTRLLNSEELRQQLGACGRARVEEKLNWSEEKRFLLRAYDAALECGQA